MADFGKTGSRRGGRILDLGQVAVKTRSFRYAGWMAGRTAVKLIPPLERVMPIYDDVARYVDAGTFETVEEVQTVSLSADDTEHLAKARLPVPKVLRRSVALVALEGMSLLGATGAVIDETKKRLLTRRDGRTYTTYHDFLAEPSRRVDKTGRNYVSMVGPYRNHRHFYHFLVERLPRLRYLIEKFPLGSAPVTVLTNETLPQFQKDIYSFIAGKYPNISFEAVPHRERWHLDRLYLIDDFQPVEGTRIGLDPALMMPETADFIRKLVSEGFGIPISQPRRRIYVARSDAKKRRLLNEEAVLPVLERHGFEIVAPGTLSFRDQAALFAQAEIIAGPHGAGLTNILFAPPGADVIEISPADKITIAYPMLAKCAGHRFTGIIGTRGDRQEHFTVDIAEFGAKLDAIEDARRR